MFWRFKLCKVQKDFTAEMKKNYKYQGLNINIFKIVKEAFQNLLKLNRTKVFIIIEDFLSKEYLDKCSNNEMKSTSLNSLGGQVVALLLIIAEKRHDVDDTPPV